MGFITSTFHYLQRISLHTKCYRAKLSGCNASNHDAMQSHGIISFTSNSSNRYACVRGVWCGGSQNINHACWNSSTNNYYLCSQWRSTWIVTENNSIHHIWFSAEKLNNKSLEKILSLLWRWFRKLTCAISIIGEIIFSNVGQIWWCQLNFWGLAKCSHQRLQKRLCISFKLQSYALNFAFHYTLNLLFRYA